MAFGIIVSVLSFSSSPAAPEWKPIFNGKDLSGWYTYLDGRGANKDTDTIFRVEDSAIHVYAKHVAGSTQPFGYVSTSKEYTRYKLRFQVKWGTKKFAPRATAKRDAGVLVHVGNPDKVWPRTLEYQIQEGDIGDIWSLGNVWVTTMADPQSLTTGSKVPRFQEASAGGVRNESEGSKNFRIIKSADHETPDGTPWRSTWRTTAPR